MSLEAIAIKKNKIMESFMVEMAKTIWWIINVIGVLGVMQRIKSQTMINSKHYSSDDIIPRDYTSLFPYLDLLINVVMICLLTIWSIIITINFMQPNLPFRNLNPTF